MLIARPFLSCAILSARPQHGLLLRLACSFGRCVLTHHRVLRPDDDMASGAIAARCRRAFILLGNRFRNDGSTQ